MWACPSRPCPPSLFHVRPSTRDGAKRYLTAIILPEPSAVARNCSIRRTVRRPEDVERCCDAAPTLFPRGGLFIHSVPYRTGSPHRVRPADPVHVGGDVAGAGRRCCAQYFGNDPLRKSAGQSASAGRRPPVPD